MQELDPNYYCFDSLLYRNEDYIIQSNLLLDTINLSPYSAIMKDMEEPFEYQCEWAFMDSKIHLLDISCNNEELKNLILDNAEIICNFISCPVKYVVKKENNAIVWLFFEKGTISDIRIEPVFSWNYKELNFGKYEGHSYMELLFGKINSDLNAACRSYIENLILFLSDKNFDYFYKMPIKLSISQNDKFMASKLREMDIYSLKTFVTNTIVVISNDHFIGSENDFKLDQKLSKFLEKVLICSYESLGIFGKPNVLSLPIHKDSVLLNRDSSYLEWLITNVDKFNVHPDLLEKKYRYNIIYKFNIKRLSPTIFEYSPILKSIENNVPSEICEINRTKFCQSNLLEFCEENKTYFANEDELINNYQFYTDEYYDPSAVRYFYDDNDDHICYDEYGGAYGFDDDTINSAFEGDPDNYWNID